MTQYVAFLRAINVGGHTVKMDRLRQLFMRPLGLSNVETYIASGNVLFESAARNTRTLEQKIATGLHKSLGFEVDTFIRTLAELAEIAKYKPFEEKSADPAAGLYIGLLAEPLSRGAQQTVMSFRSKVDDFHIHLREIYWRCKVGSSESEFSLARLGKALGIRATFRNSTTIRKMAALHNSPETVA